MNLSVAPGEYVVIGAYPPGEAVAREDREYIGVSAGGVESGETIEKYLQVKVKNNKKK